MCEYDLFATTCELAHPNKDRHVPLQRDNSLSIRVHCPLTSQVLSPEAASLAVKDVLECTDEEARNHLKTFFEVMSTSSQLATYTSGKLTAWVWRGCVRGGGWFLESGVKESLLAVT